MKRYLHNKSHYHLCAASMGELTPISCVETIPGDTVEVQPMGLMRFSPLVTPVMHPVSVTLESYFVPNRILDPADGSFEWEKFITGGEDGLYNSPIPRVSGATVSKGDIMEHLGITPGTRSYNAFVPRAYAKIWNEYFRDQQLQAAIDIETFNGAAQPLKVSWERDYFTSARPEPQLGEETLLPLGTSAPVVPGGDGYPSFSSPNHPGIANIMFRATDVTAEWTSSGVPVGESAHWDDPKLVADLQSATAVSVTDLREAFAIQRYKEARNLYGSRFTEYLRYLGIKSSDARLQRPELVSRGRATVNFSEVLNTASNDEEAGATKLDPLGRMGGHGIAGIRGRRARYFCEEHGHIITLMYCRPRTMYLQGQHRMYDRATKEDYWQKELQHLGQEPVTVGEVYNDATDPTAVFGWVPRYESFRRVPSYVSGDFRDVLDSWHLARNFATEPALNASFIECDPSERIFADTATETDKLWCTFKNRIAVRSMLRKGISASVR